MRKLECGKYIPVDDEEREWKQSIQKLVNEVFNLGIESDIIKIRMKCEINKIF